MTEHEAPLAYTLLIPMYNEEAILPAVLPRVSRCMREAFPAGSYEILFVDDGSADRSAALVEEYRAESDPAVRLLSYRPNRGKGCAVRRGMLDARGETIVFTDCDLAYGTDAVIEMFTFLGVHPEFGAVIGSRALHPDGYRGYSHARLLVSRVYRGILRLFFGLRLSDSQGGLKGFRRAAAQEIFSRCEVDRFAFDFEAILVGEARGVLFGEMPACVVENRPHGKVHVVRDGVRMMRDLFRIRRRVRRMRQKTGAEA